MSEKPVDRAETHVRVHDQTGYVMSIDIHADVRTVIDHILELQTIQAKKQMDRLNEVAGRLDARNPELMPEVETNV